MVISLLELDGEDQADDYIKEFHRLHPSGEIIDVLGRRVLFRPADARHVCYMTAQDSYNAGKRAVWSLERAQRIPWIRFALEQPFEIRPNKVDNRYTYLTRVCQKSEGEEEYYCVIVECSPENKAEKIAYFVTAYNIQLSDWDNYRKEGIQIYPPLDEELKQRLLERKKRQKENEQEKKAGKKEKLRQLREERKAQETRERQARHDRQKG